jgi:transposase-like protein
MSKVSWLEVITTGARRRWRDEEKRRIVAESFDGQRRVSATARRYGLRKHPVKHADQASRGGRRRSRWSIPDARGKRGSL